MELIQKPNIRNGYTPYIEHYEKIYEDLGQGESSNLAISANSLSALDSDLFNVSATTIFLHDQNYLTSFVTGGGSTIFGSKSIAGNYGVYYRRDFQNPNWALTSTFDPNVYNGKYIYSKWSYDITDSASASISGCFAYPTNDSTGKTKDGIVISAYPDFNYFCISAYAWNSDSENLLYEPESLLITKIDGITIINELTRNDLNSSYFWVVDLNNSVYANGKTVEWYLMVKDTWSQKLVYSGTGSFVVKDSIDNSISSDTYGGGYGTNSITGAYSCMAISLGYGTGDKWIKICGTDWS